MKTFLALFLLFFFASAPHAAFAIENSITAQKGEKWKMTIVPDSAERREIDIKGADDRPHTVQVNSETLNMESFVDHSRKDFHFLAVYDPKTRFVAWTVSTSTTESVVTHWLNTLWLVPDVGIIRLNGTTSGIRLEIFKTRPDDFAKWKTMLLETMTASTAEEAFLAPYEERYVRLSQSLGRDFFSRPGDASIPPPVKIVSVKPSETGLTIELQSGVITDKAIISLDPAFGVLRAFRNDKQVTSGKDDW